ncbi:hypothetical protein [Dyadobacter frigoris]|uniref:Uncharacterized protein n=1 Tax=Dyadobacter frigoris TaxID=2576211 RepID=A0A4U6CY21_9BACT|nr:hypothetical protein [Dyadobacter frigoris]TKT88138.1 hypothetical protein FDK13_27585 [Dyadobacter frigoris]GLU53753.1 hypothetical protein Dfri01_32140 [Dyadobacter frigoris]
MDKNIQIPGFYIIRYQTAPVVPAPFANFQTMKLQLVSEDDLSVDFSIKYTDREDLEEDEILDEGFTMDDDFSWKGAVPANWIKEFEKIYTSSKIIRQREEKEFEDFVEIEIEENDKRVTVYPVDKERWVYFLQEFMQAILETSGRELPFELTYLDLDAEPASEVALKASFATKIFTMSENGGSAKLLDWGFLQKVMDTVYRAEFVYDNASETKPKKGGKYIYTGDQLWYQLGVAVVETTAKSKDLQMIESLFSKLVR